MINFKERSKETEILDKDDLPFEDVKICMKELNSINTLLGGHSITLHGINTFYPKQETHFIVCEIGSGGGDNLKAISKKFTNAAFIGIDLKESCINFAKHQYKELNAEWISSDYSKVQFKNKPDIIFSSLFCHHFTNDQLVVMLNWMKQNSQNGFFINDLQRNTTAYYLIKWLTALFSKSYMVKMMGLYQSPGVLEKKTGNYCFRKQV